MRRQQYANWCGQGAAHNLLQFYGKKIPQRKLRIAAKAKRGGTTAPEMRKAFLAYGLKAPDFVLTNKRQANEMLSSLVGHGPVIIAVQKGQHYVVLLAVTKRRFMVIDSAWSDEARKENGMHVVSRKQLMRAWSDEDGEYQIIIPHW